MRPLEVLEKLHSFYLYISARGANVNKVNSKGYTPLHDAVKRGDLEVVTELLAYGADSALDVKAGSV
jgi:ankyrin repeat protein